MESYRIELKRSAAKEIRSIPGSKDRARIVERIDRLGDDPRPPGSRKLSGQQSTRRVRQGLYRIVYTIDDSVRVVTIVRVRLRRDVYKR